MKLLMNSPATYAVMIAPPIIARMTAAPIEAKMTAPAMMSVYDLVEELAALLETDWKD